MGTVEEEGDWEAPDVSHIAAAFLCGALLPVLLLGIGVYLNPENPSGFFGGRFQLLLAALFIGISTGHFLGIALGGGIDRILAAAVGAFLALSGAFVYTIYMEDGTGILFGPGGLLAGFAFVLILGHYSDLIEKIHSVEDLIEIFAKRLSPALLGFMWLMESVIPPLLDPISSRLDLGAIWSAVFGGIKLILALCLIGFVVWVVDKAKTADS